MAANDPCIRAYAITGSLVRVRTGRGRPATRGAPEWQRPRPARALPPRTVTPTFTPPFSLSRSDVAGPRAEARLPHGPGMRAAHCAAHTLYGTRTHTVRHTRTGAQTVRNTHTLHGTHTHRHTHSVRGTHTVRHTDTHRHTGTHCVRGTHAVRHTHTVRHTHKQTGPPPPTLTQSPARLSHGIHTGPSPRTLTLTLPVHESRCVLRST